MEKLMDIYERFISNYRTDTGGINLYPQFDCDLEWLLKWLLEYLEEDVDTMDYEVDCSWRQPEGGCDE